MATTSKPTSKATEGEPIGLSAPGKISVPDRPIIPFIEGDGTGPDIWRASQRVFDAAVEKAYGGKRKIAWSRCWPARRLQDRLDNWLPDETVEAFRNYLVGIKGPLTTPVGGGIRSLNVALRQMLDLYVCLRPVRYFRACPRPVKQPELVDMVIFRENTEDIYAGIEWPAGTPEAKKVDRLPAEGNGRSRRSASPSPAASASSRSAARAPSAWSAPPSTTRSPTSATSVTLVHKGNIMKFTEGAFRDWGYELAARSTGQAVAVGRLRRQAAGRASCSSRTPSPTPSCSRS